jgi:hypothetical protein
MDTQYAYAMADTQYTMDTQYAYAMADQDHFNICDGYTICHDRFNALAGDAIQFASL